MSPHSRLCPHRCQCLVDPEVHNACLPTQPLSHQLFPCPSICVQSCCRLSKAVCAWSYHHLLKAVRSLSRAQLAPSRVPAKLRTSPSKPALKPSYSHIVKQGLKTPTRDPGNTHVMKSRAPPVLQVSRVTPRDPGKQESRVTTRDLGKPGDLPRDWSSARPRDVTRFRRAARPLIGTWKTVGQSTVDRRINKVTRLTIVTHAQSAVNAA